LQGRYVLLTFGYTHCPDVCPVTLAELRRVHDLLAEQGKAEQVQLVFISVDGQRDTPERLKQYLTYFNAGVIGLTGTREQAEALISQFGGTFNINNVAGAIENYTVDHTAGSFLLAPDGTWVRRYAYRTDPKLIAEDLLQRLRI
jgi:protein SCO1